MILNSIFAGKAGPPRDVVLLNAAAVLVVSGLSNNLRDGIQLAARAIDTAAVQSLVSALQSN
jgi:anthranilate phosphoribosyltransferase